MVSTTSIIAHRRYGNPVDVVEVNNFSQDVLTLL